MAMQALLVDRHFYRSSGKANWGAFLVRQVGLAALGVVAALVMFSVYTYLFHLVVVMPVFAGVFLGFMGQQAVDGSRCRNRWAAAAGGILAGCVFFFGTYYFELVWFAGSMALTRFDLIPDMIAIDVKHSVLFHHLHPQGAPNVVINAAIVAIEFLCAIGPAAWLPFDRASRIYCEHCEKWSESISTTVEFDAGAKIVSALETEQLRDLPEFPIVDSDISQRNCVPCTLVRLDHCAEGAETGCPIYLSLRRYPKHRGSGRVRVKRVEIDQLEALRLMSKMPGLRGLDGSDADLGSDDDLPEDPEDSIGDGDPSFGTAAK
jgi:hypothetical protein